MSKKSTVKLNPQVDKVSAALMQGEMQQKESRLAKKNPVLDPEFADKMPLLRIYAGILCGAGERVSLNGNVGGPKKEERTKEDEIKAMRIKRDNTIFLFDFVFKKMFGFKTYEEAVEAVDKDEYTYLYKTHLHHYLDSNNIFIWNLSDRPRVIQNRNFVLWVIYNNIDIESDIIKCYDYLIEQNYRGKNELIMERERILSVISRSRLTEK